MIRTIMIIIERSKAMDKKTLLKKASSLMLAALVSFSGVLGSSGGISMVNAASATVTYDGPASWDGAKVGKFKVNGQDAFCLEHPKTSPGTGTKVTSSVYDNATIRKILYYGFGGEDASFWGEGGNRTARARIITTLALDEVYGSKKKWKRNEKFFSFINKKADPGTNYLKFSKTNPKVSYNAQTGLQTSETFTVNGEGNTKSASFSTGNSNVTMHNITTGKSGTKVTVKAGDKVYLTAPKTYSGSINRKNVNLSSFKYQAIIWKTSSSSLQDLATLAYAQDPTHYTSLKATFVGTASVQISKYDASGSKEISGAVLQLSDSADNVIDKWTSNGSPHVVGNLFLNASYKLAEISAPEGYKIASPVTFTLTEDMQKVSMKDERESISIRTKASDSQSNSHRGTFGQKVTIRDTVSYTNLIKGKSYRVSGVLHVKNADGKDGGVLKDASGKEIRAEKTFTASRRNGTVDLVYTLDSRNLKGKSTVVFEDLYEEEKHVASHADIKDENQEVFYPEIRTTASSQGTDAIDDDSAKEKMIEIRDAVAYTNLVSGKEYTLKGTLMDKETGKAFLGKDGKAIKAEKTFTASGRKGTVDVNFSVPASLLRGKTTVVFEEAYEGNVHVASHADITDRGQTLEFPKAQTKAGYDDSIDYDEEKGTTEIRDTVSYTNLKVGKEYVVKGTLMDKATGKAFLDKDGKAITAQTVFTPAKKDGTVEVVFNVASKLLKGKTTVVFEKIYKDNVLVVTHEDINDEGQTIEWPGMGTEATSDGKKEADLSHRTIISDKVEYRNLKPGKKYTLKGALMNKATGKELLDRDGKAITAQTVFTPEKSSGTAEVEFVFDGIHLGEGVETVVFESLYKDNVLVMTHADINDEGQTVKFRPVLTDIKVNKVDAMTGKAIVSKQFEFTLYADEACTQPIITADADRKAGAAMFKGLKFGTYYIKETKAPAGYQLSKEVVKVVVDKDLENVGEVYEIRYADTPLPAAGANIPASPVVATGDDAQIMGYAFMAGIAALALVIYGISRKKKED